jgi:hypothetical protein
VPRASRYDRSRCARFARFARFARILKRRSGEFRYGQRKPGDRPAGPPNSAIRARRCGARHLRASCRISRAPVPGPSRPGLVQADRAAAAACPGQQGYPAAGRVRGPRTAARDARLRVHRGCHHRRLRDVAQFRWHAARAAAADGVPAGRPAARRGPPPPGRPAAGAADRVTASVVAAAWRPGPGPGGPDRIPSAGGPVPTCCSSCRSRRSPRSSRATCCSGGSPI